MTTSAGSRAYDQIRMMIIGGSFGPGERLKEEELTAICGTSRTPVREALRRLSAEGLIVQNPRVGAQVASVSIADLEEVYSLRMMLESHAAARAATRITDEQIAEMKRIAVILEAAVAKGEAETQLVYPKVNAEFHAIFLEAADSPRLAAMAESVQVLPLIMRTLVHYSREDRERSMRQHQELIDALEARNPTWAAAVVQTHLHNAYNTLIKAAESQPAAEAKKPSRRRAAWRDRPRSGEARTSRTRLRTA